MKQKTVANFALCLLITVISLVMTNNAFAFNARNLSTSTNIQEIERQKKTPITINNEPSVMDAYLYRYSYDGKIYTTPLRCTGQLSPWTSVRSGEISSEVTSAHTYYMDPRNTEGNYQQRREKLARVTRDVFTSFITKRTREYRSVTCFYRGVDWNSPGKSSWSVIKATPGFKFVTGSLRRTMNGDWKGHTWKNGETELHWKTGGHRRSSTFAEVTAEYANIEQRVIAELNTARKVLHDRGIPNELP